MRAWQQGHINARPLLLFLMHVLPPAPPALPSCSYKQPVMVVTVGVHCIDLRGCVPPQDHLPSAAEDAAWVAAGACPPAWSCCHWDDATPGLESKSPLELVQATDGPTGFIEVAANGTWLAHLPLAGHGSLLDPGSKIFAGVHDCPAAVSSAAILPDAGALIVAFLEHKLRGQAAVEPLTLAWAANKPAQQLRLSIKQ